MIRTKKRIAILAILLCLLFALLWRALPHAFSDVISVDVSSICEFTCSATMIGAAEGDFSLTSYSMPPLSSGKEGFGEVLEILSAGKYLQDFRNLLPWPIHTVSADGSTCSVLLSFSWGEPSAQSCNVSFLDRNIVSVRYGKSDGLKIFHPTDDSVLDSLAEYIQLHGDQINQQN